VDTESVPTPAAPQPPPESQPPAPQPIPPTLSELPPAEGKAVYADITGTLGDFSYLGLLQAVMKRFLGGFLFRVWQLGLLVKTPYWFLLGRFSPQRLHASICYEYTGMDNYDMQEIAEVLYRSYIKPLLYPDAMKTLRDFSERGYRVVLITSEVNYLMRPLARELKAELIASELVENVTGFTGAVENGALTDERKANAIRSHAEEHGINLQISYAYGDDATDLQMLECVGHPVAVNPDSRLEAVANERKWMIEHWQIGPLKSERARGKEE
jgi:HAD superfamily hydrolase (TIGR01490 family)